MGCLYTNEEGRVVHDESYEIIQMVGVVSVSCHAFSTLSAKSRALEPFLTDSNIG